RLVKMLLGVESDFTKSPWALLNSTFFMAMLALTWLCVDPIVKVLYALRCFYGEALQSGEDLKADLKQFAAVQPAAALMAALLLVIGASGSYAAESPAPAAPPAGPPVVQPA